MIVCIAEKPSVAKDIAKIIGADKAKKGYMEGNGYQVTWTYGHLCTLKEPDNYTPNWKRWSLAALPMIPQTFGIKLIEDKGIKAQFDVIKQLMQHADTIINCGDAGQEGELIQRWVMQKAGAKCNVKRLWISSLTEEAIREGFNALKDQKNYDPLYMAGLCRSIGDWILGINATRLYTLKYGRDRQILSVGRVQTPTLALIVSRQKEIQNFVPETYWVLSATYRKTIFTATKGKYTLKEDAQQAYAKIKDKDITIQNVVKKKGSEAPPHLFDLTSLQVECNKKFGFSAEQTLNIIQSLYEQKLTTYPRVDTQYLSDDIYPKCAQIIKGITPRYADAQCLLNAKLQKRKKIFDSSKVTDHHAIIPTGLMPQALTPQHADVYDLIAKRFIAAFYPDCIFSTTTVTADIDGIPFKATGKEILAPGWKELYGNAAESTAKEDADESEDNNDGNATSQTLPTFVKGETGPQKPSLAEKQTTPPKHYTEATLLRAMETAGKFVEDETLRQALKENGIGRPSSRASIIETLFKRKYIRRERKKILATQTGVELIDIIKDELLKSCELTGIWEKRLRDIEHRKYDPKQFVEELKTQIHQIVKEVLQDNRKLTPQQDVQVKKRKQTTIKTEGRTPKAKNVNNNKEVKSQSQDTSSFIPKVGDACPLCGVGKIIRGKTANGCSRWKEGCDYRLPFAE